MSSTLQEEYQKLVEKNLQLEIADKEKKQKIEKLEGDIKRYMDLARDNEVTHQRLQQFECMLMGMDNFGDFLNAIINQYRETFNLSRVTLLMLDREHEVRRLLEKLGLREQFRNDMILIHNEDLMSELVNSQSRVKLGPYRASEHAGYFRHYSEPPASVAILPLIRHNRVIGSLNLASNDMEKYTEDKATELLSRMATIVGVCFENVVNYHRLENVSLTDSLTGISNRRYFEKRLYEEIKRVMRDDLPMSCLLLDVDNFKQVNDQYGHPAGDKVLQVMAEVVGSYTRTQDVFARYGGEEFVLLLPNSDAENSRQVANRMCDAIRETAIDVGDGKQLNVTISIGLSELTPKLCEIDEMEHIANRLVAESDKALYKAKHQGKDQVVVASW
jgi:diguanylate cyclase (GGDEF)-like protein